MSPRRLQPRAYLLGLLVLMSGCVSSVRRFPLQAIMWTDGDQEVFSPRPREYYSPYMWDGADNSVFRPASEFFRFEGTRPAINVNAADEVPDSSWYTNRLSRHPMSPEEVADGACGPNFLVEGPWTIDRGKPDGSNPGFFVQDAQGRRFLVKPDTQLQRERPTAADPIATALLHAAGYFVPCARVAFVRREDLVLADGAEIRRTNGSREPMTEAHIDEVLRHAEVRPDGRIRFVVSQMIEGDPISPWRYEDTWEDDLNDVVPHHHRREIRGLFPMYAWINRIDSRQENTMAAWMTSGEGDPESLPGYVRHYVIDLSETFGILFQWDELAWRFGASGYLDFEHMGQDFLTLGLIDRPWHHAQRGPTGATFGYFDVERFDPSSWRPGYPNKAFTSRTEADDAWMTRILARLSDDHLRAVARLGAFQSLETETELVRILRGRLDRILNRWLSRLSPLTAPSFSPAHETPQICLEDLAVTSGIRRHSSRAYRGALYVGEALDRSPMTIASLPGQVCAAFPRWSSTAPTYAILEMIAETRGAETTFPIRVHFYQLPDQSMRLVGIERPNTFDRPFS